MKKTMTRKEKVLRTALQMVASGGFQGAPIAELAAKSKVAVGTIYHHFANKDEMVAAMYLLCKESLADSLTKVNDPKASSQKKFEKLWDAYLDHAAKNPVEFSFLDQYKSSPLITAAVVKSAEKFDAAINVFIKEGLKNKDLRKSEDAVLIEFFNANVNAAARIHVSKSKKKISSKELAGLREMTWAGLKK
ncbi:MAG: TetR/AcrR family transcriptional regulator [Flavobacteriales bacterium]